MHRVIRPAAAPLTAVLLAMAAVSLGSQQAPGGQPGAGWSEEQLKRAIAPVGAGRKLTPGAWPNGARVAVALSFDVDNQGRLAAGVAEPVAVSTREFGATVGLGRVLALLDRHNVPGTFFIPAVSAMLYPDQIPSILESGRHEIGVHGWIHENLVQLNDAAEEERLLTQAIDYLTKVTGRRPVGYRAPGWAYSPFTLSLVRKAGFLYDSSLQAMDEPYEILDNGEPSGVIALPGGWTVLDGPLLSMPGGGLPAPQLVFQTFRDDFDVAYEEGTLVMLTLHPHIIGHRSSIVHLDRLITYMKSKPGVWFTTGEQIASYVKQQMSER